MHSTRAMRSRRSNVTLAAQRIKEMHMKETRKPAREPRKPAGEKPAAKPVARSAARSTARPETKSAERVAAKPAARSAAAPAPAAGKVVRKKSAAVLPPASLPPPDGDRMERIRVAAYLRAERRGFAPGHEWEDWLAAEAEFGAATGPAGDE